MSKERALRRAVREAEQAKLRVKRERVDARRAKRRMIAARVRKMRPGRSGRIGRRSKGQRAAIAVSVALGLVLIWTLVGSVAMSIALSLLLVLTLPVLVVLAFDR